jgi:hypothetical protein
MSKWAVNWLTDPFAGSIQSELRLKTQWHKQGFGFASF